jgi:hypothetical protein
MISRDLTTLRATLDNPETSTLLSKSLRQTALKLLEDAATIQLKLADAIQTGYSPGFPLKLSLILFFSLAP